jgi:hypothetical protein
MLVEETNRRQRTAPEGREAGQLAKAPAPAAHIACKLKRHGGATIAGVETWPG